MAAMRKASWGETEFYEILCLMMVGACCWLIATQFNVFSVIDVLIAQDQVAGLLLLAVSMGIGAFVGSVRKSLHLRQATRERDRAQQETATVARRDALTGIANRLRLIEAVHERQAAGKVASVLLIDLDRFKPINDLNGHVAGDTVLRTVAGRIEKLLPKGSVAARPGSNEFAVLVGYPPTSNELVRLSRELIAAISQPIVWENAELLVGATIGIAPVAAASDAEDILQAADLALVHAKKDNRGGYRLFEPSMSEELKLRAARERELRAAIDAGEIAPYYQPVVSLTTRALTGFEVLARWPHPTLGLLPPSEFISVAEETGMIADLSYLLLRRACEDALQWPNHLQLAVNISPQQFEDPLLASKILAILNETGFDPSRLEVEITESALVKDLDATRRTLTSLQDLGVRIALDDFGTGYSSLYHLRELRFDKLKIDRSYVNTIAMGDDRARLVDAIIKLGTSLGLVTTAEGIETDSSVDWLENQGCDYGQGYLFGKPMSKDQTDLLFADGMLPSKAGEPVPETVSMNATEAA